MTDEHNDARSLVGSLGAVAVVAGLGFLIAGWPGAMVAGGGLLVTPRASGSKAPATAAAAFLALAALATVLEAPVGTANVNLAYALARPLADAAGRMAALLTLVAIASAAAGERAPADTRLVAPGPDGHVRAHKPPARDAPSDAAPERAARGRE